MNRQHNLHGVPVVPGCAQGPVLLASEAISFWGGIDAASGRIIDHRHDRFGESVVDRVFVLPGEKGSSTGSAVLLELIRTGNAPCAIVTFHPAPILVLGAIVAEELYGVTMPVIQLFPVERDRLIDGEIVRILPDGSIIQESNRTSPRHF